MVGQANCGTIKGRLVWGGDNVPPAVVLEKQGQAQKDPNVCAKDQSILSHEMEVDPKTKGSLMGSRTSFDPRRPIPKRSRN